MSGPEGAAPATTPAREERGRERLRAEWRRTLESLPDLGDGLAKPPGHPTRRIRYRSQQADVDEDLAPIVLALWRRGIRTTSSCQGGEDFFLGRAAIQFERISDAARLLELVVDPSENGRASLSWRMLSSLYEQDAPEEQVWDYGASLTAWGRPYDKRGHPHFEFSISVEFPPSDIPELARRLGIAR